MKASSKNKPIAVVRTNFFKVRTLSTHQTTTAIGASGIKTFLLPDFSFIIGRAF
jgi:hypothetical protein